MAAFSSSIDSYFQQYMSHGCYHESVSQSGAIICVPVS